ncbi:MAG: SDR family oxidoreductase [bacterium]|nr:SDR family oxidoreductase [bacterium]
MKLLFLGGTGVISEAVSQLAAERGHDVTLVNRGLTVPSLTQRARVIRCDVRDVRALATALAGHMFDVVVDWIAYVPEHVQTDLRLFRGKTGQYVFISSATVYEKPPRSYRITEETPRGNPYSVYAQNKIACEDLLFEAWEREGFPMTIVRPSYTYGNTKIPSDIGVTDYTLVDRMKRGKPVIVHGDGQSLWTLTHNSDFAVALLGLCGQTRALGEAFHITSEEVLTWDQIYQAIGAAAGVTPQLVHVPVELIEAYDPGKTAGLRGDKMYSMVFDNSKVKRLVPEFVARVPFAEGVRRAVAWFEADAARQRVNDEANVLIDRIIAGMERALPARGTVRS